MTPPVSATVSYGVVGVSGIVLWGISLETWMGLTVWVLTIALLIARLCVDVPRAIRKRKDK